METSKTTAKSLSQLSTILNNIVSVALPVA